VALDGRSYLSVGGSIEGHVGVVMVDLVVMLVLYDVYIYVYIHVYIKWYMKRLSRQSCRSVIGAGSAPLVLAVIMSSHSRKWWPACARPGGVGERGPWVRHTIHGACRYGHHKTALPFYLTCGAPSFLWLCDASAHAGHRSTNAVLRAMQGEEGVAICAFVENDLTEVGACCSMTLSDQKAHV
jgi:hypothetical protein